MTTCTNKNCGYEWEPRTSEPRACPKCKQYLKDNSGIKPATQRTKEKSPTKLATKHLHKK